MRKIYPVQWENPTIGTNTLRDVPLDTQGIPRLGWAKVFFTLKFYMFVFCSQNMGSWVKFFHHKTSLPPPLEFQNGVPINNVFVPIGIHSGEKCESSAQPVHLMDNL